MNLSFTVILKSFCCRLEAAYCSRCNCWKRSECNSSDCRHFICDNFKKAVSGIYEPFVLSKTSYLSVPCLVTYYFSFSSCLALTFHTFVSYKRQSSAPVSHFQNYFTIKRSAKLPETLH